MRSLANVPFSKLTDGTISALLVCSAASVSGAVSADEVGTNDFRISVMGNDSETDAGVRAQYDGQNSGIAYNSTNDEFLVVWFGDTDSGSLVDGENEIWGQRVDGATGSLLGSNFRISDMGATDGSTAYGATNPAAAYDSTNNEYLVVWVGDDDTGSLVDGEFEIYGQRINAATGAEVGTNDFRISDMGSMDGDTTYGAGNPDVAYNSTNNEYLVVWNGDDDTGSLVNNEFEVYGQRINAATGAEIGTNDFRISDMGSVDGVTSYGAFVPKVAYDSVDNEYLVVWQGDDDSGSLVDNESEIWGQRISGATGAEVGTNDFRISDLGPDGDGNYDAAAPDVTYSSASDEYLVIWNGDDNTGTLVDGENEVFGQLIEGDTGAETGTNDFRISDMGTDGSTSYGAFNSEATYNGNANEFLVVWQGDDNSGTVVDGEFEIWGQRIDGSGAEVGDNDFRISDMGPDGNTSYVGGTPNCAFTTATNEYLVVWSGDDDSPPLVDGESELFGQFLDAPAVVWVDFSFNGMPELGTIANPYNTLAEGVSAASSGGFISILAGTSPEMLMITKQVTLQSVGIVRVGVPAAR